MYQEEEGFFARNKIVSYSIIISCMLFIFVFACDWAKSLRRFIPIFRGEISLNRGIVITKIHDTYPILIRANDPFFGSRLRYYGTNKSTFAHAAHLLCKPTDNIADVGAYFGYTSIIVGTEILKQQANTQNCGKIFSYEPNERICSYFKKSVVLNDLENIIQINPVAIMDRIGNCNIYNALALKSMSRQKKYEPELDQEPQELTVRCSTLDKELGCKVDHLNLLLVDVGGIAFLVLRGAGELIEKSPDVKILVNFNKAEVEEFSDCAAEFLRLKDQGMRFYLVKDYGELLVETNPKAIMQEEEAVFLIMRQRLPQKETKLSQSGL